MKEHLVRLCAPVLEANGFELVDAEWKRHRRQRVVALYIHRPGGVTIADCQRALRLLEPMLRVEGILDDQTQFEVASPGLDRPLKTAADFRRAEGYDVVIRRRLGEDPAREERLVGNVTAVTDDAVTLLLETNEVVVIPLSEIIQGKFEIPF